MSQSDPGVGAAAHPAGSVPSAPPTAPDSTELIQLFLAGRNVRCPVCGFNLRDGTGTKCPECGTELRLHIHPVIRFPGLYVFSVLGLLCGVAFSGIAAAFFWRFGGAGLIVCVTGFVVSLLHLVVLELRWRRWMRPGAEHRNVHAAACWVVAMLCAGMIAWQLMHWL